MNIGIVTTWFERGAAYVSRAYLESLSGHHNVFIYARGGETYGIGDPNWDKPFVTWGKKTKILSETFIDWVDFKKWVFLNDLKVIMFNEQRNWDIIIKCQKLDLLLGAYIDYYTKSTVDYFRLYDFLLCNTKRHFGVFKNHPQVLYIPWGTDLSVCKPIPRKRDGYIMFFHSAGMSGLHLRKGTDILVRAFQKLKGNTRLIIHSQVGLEKYSAVASLIKGDPRIDFFVGTCPLPGLYYKGDVYVYPSRLEGIGLSIAEALACGLPVITTNCPPMSEFVLEGETGKLVKVENYIERQDGYYWPESICSEEALVDAMQYYIDHQEELPNQQKNARKYAEDFLSWKKNSSSLHSIIQEMVRTRKNNIFYSLKVQSFNNKMMSPERIRLADQYYDNDEWGKVISGFLKGIFFYPKSLLSKEFLLLFAKSVIKVLLYSKFKKKIIR